MAANADEEAFIMKLGALARVAPQQWREFLVEYRKYVESEKLNLINATPDMLQIRQGFCKNAVVLQGKFENAVDAANALQKKLEANRSIK